jgi:CBS domain-containing protein
MARRNDIDPRAGRAADDDGHRGGPAGWGGEDDAYGAAPRAERYPAGGGSGYAGPSGLGWHTGPGYGAGATGYPDPSNSGLAGTRGGGEAGWRDASGPARNRGPKGWQRSDARIHEDVCERLAAEHGIDPSEVEVAVQEGTVTLTGSVPDRGMKYRIEDIVDACSGVRDVDNRLRVSRGGLGALLGGPMGGLGTTTEARGTSKEATSRGGLLGRLFGLGGATKLADVMTRNPRTVGPEETLQSVATLMKELDVGAIPVVSGQTLAGMVTDRDIVVRGVAAGVDLKSAKVAEVMTTQVHACYEDEAVETALDRMGDLQVRRIPVLDREDRLVGIVSLGDFAQREAGDVEDALQDISTPT